MIDVATFRRIYLRNLDLEDVNGDPMPDTDLQVLLDDARTEFEREFAVRLKPALARVGPNRMEREPDSQDHPPDGATPEEIDALLPVEHFDPLPYDARSFEHNRHAHLRLPVGPVKTVHGVGLELPGRTDLFELPEHGIQVQKRRKSLQIYWKMGFDYHPILAASAVGFQALTSGRSIPNTWNVTYTAGYTPDDLDGQDADVKAAVAKVAAIKSLMVGSADRNFALGLGTRTVSADGLSQTTQLIASGQNLKYGALMAQYAEELQRFRKMYAHRKSGVRFGLL